MSRLFDDVGSTTLDSAVVPITDYPFTIACWFKSDDITINQTLYEISNSSDIGNRFRLSARGDLAGDPIRFNMKDGITIRNADSTTGFSANTWTHACAVGRSATSRDVYINGGDKGSNTGAGTPTGLNGVSVGGTADLASFMSGNIAEIAVWNIALTDAEVALLTTRISAFLMHPESLVSYCRLIGTPTEEPDIILGFGLVDHGTTIADHPPIFYPSRTSRGLVFDITGTNYTQNIAGAPGDLLGALTIQTNKVIAGTLTSMSGSIGKFIYKSFSGTMGALTGSASSLRVIVIELTGVVGALTGGVTKRTNKALDGITSTVSGSLTILAKAVPYVIMKAGWATIITKITGGRSKDQ
jgi:hypothetical protein